MKEREYLQNGGDAKALESWKKDGQVAPGFLPLDRRLEASKRDGLFFNERIERRQRQLAQLRKMGKGKPKKGEFTNSDTVADLQEKGRRRSRRRESSLGSIW